MKRFVFFSWVLITTIVLIASSSEQIVIEKKFKRQINYIFPEGWGFFTKNPRDLVMSVFSIRDKELNRIEMSNHSLTNNLGLSRKTRIIGFEASIIAKDIPKEFWKEDISINVKNRLNDSVLIVKKKPHFNHITEGEYIFKLYRQIPYAWADKNQEKYNPAQFARVRVE